MKITYEQIDLLLSLLPRLVDQLEREAAGLMLLKSHDPAAEETAKERYQLSQDVAELVSQLMLYQEEGDHA